MSRDTGLSESVVYLAVDLSGIKSSDTDYLVTLFQKYCQDHGYTLLVDDINGLIDKGYIKDRFFKDGILLCYDDQSITDKSLITHAKKWRSGTGAIGATYTVTNNNDTWEITDTTDNWIS